MTSDEASSAWTLVIKTELAEAVLKQPILVLSRTGHASITHKQAVRTAAAHGDDCC